MCLDREIKKELRASMNGVLSARMREAGMPFKLIFGVELPRLQSIANEFPRDAELACQLWSQNIRETKLLAIMLMPPAAFTPELSGKWKETMVTAEEAQVMAMMLLQKTSHAKETCLSWLDEGKALPSVCACLCLRHLLKNEMKLSEEELLFIKEKTAKLSRDANLHLKKAILALKDAI